MNILVFSEAAWDNKNSFGNTVSNFFEGQIWDDVNFSNFYCRNQMPDNNINIQYYNLSVVDTLRGIIKGKIKGRRFSTSELSLQKSTLEKEHINEQRRIDKIHQNTNHLVYFVHELIWLCRIWLNTEFKSFITDNRPDVLFAFSTSPFILWPLIKYFKREINCKVVLLAADEVYGSYDKLPLFRRCYLKPLLKKCIINSDRMYGISKEMSELYQQRFSIPVTTLYKGCALSYEPKGYTNQPMKIVYAGNLLWGRADILLELGKTLEEINSEGLVVQLQIYTGTTLTAELQQKLNIGESSKVMGARSYEDIKKIMHDADITLHVESFEEKQKQLVKYSFSTKIIDCLQSGTCVLGIGPSDIASIEYLNKIKGAHVIDDLSVLNKTIRELIENPQSILQDAEIIREFALENHEISTVQAKLRKELLELVD